MKNLNANLPILEAREEITSDIKILAEYAKQNDLPDPLLGMLRIIDLEERIQRRQRDNPITLLKEKNND